MDQELKLRLIECHFINLLYTENEFDPAIYASLVQDLKLMANEWRISLTIDKEVMATVYVMPHRIQSIAIRFPEQQWDIEQMAVEIDGLVLGNICPHVESDQSRLDALELRLLDDRFTRLLYLENQFEREAYETLVHDLKLLKARWRFVTAIDPEVMSSIYYLAKLTQNMAASFPEHEAEILVMSGVLDGLVMDCLGCPPEYHGLKYDTR